VRLAAGGTTYFGTNVKMYQTARESIAFVEGIAALRTAADLQLFAILPFTSLSAVVDRAHAAGIWVGAQNLHWAGAGEFTGEISAPMLRDLGVDLVLIGHAERRGVFGETDALVRRKVEAALAHGLRVLLCVGETADERACGAGPETLMRQLKLALHGISDLAAVLIAYEPVWAIGEAGSAADAATVGEAAAAIRSYTGSLPLVYGGSVTAASAPTYAAVAGIDGLFVGRAARTADGFSAVARAAYAPLLAQA
jgi:triosephosphate isomerase